MVLSEGKRPTLPFHRSNTPTNGSYSTSSSKGPLDSTSLAGGPRNKYFTCELSEDGAVRNLANHDPTGLASAYGIEERWVDFTTVKTVVTCNAAERTRDCEPVNISQVRYPTDSGNVTASNPKDIVMDALPTVANLSTTIIARQLELIIGACYGPTDGLAQIGPSMLVFMITRAISDMSEVKPVGEEEKKELKEEQLIGEFLSIMFAFIPFLDELAPEIEGLDLVLSFIDVGANTAFPIQDIFANSEPAPMEIPGPPTAGGVRYEDEFASMAATRRDISADDIGKIGTTFRKLDK